MSRQVREAREKAEKLLAKKSRLVDETLKAELSNYLALSKTLEADYQRFKREAKDRRLALEAVSRSLSRAVRRARRCMGNEAGAD